MACTVCFYNWFQRFSRDGSIENCSWDAFTLSGIVNTVITTDIAAGNKVYTMNASDGRTFRTTEEVLEPIKNGEGLILFETEPGNDGGAIFRRMSNQKFVSFYDVRGLIKD